ncbi:helix-turn-helix domain-containing protein [Parvibaculum sp.]|uniref:helix-turn-helix domain-containing protein n=1 Tax=Parvibaculum sp. TaxID=2024848 RepID=UPI001B26E280|nr:helix-turn-helix domain-containing protein [Parvibaculum sp.]MBO6634181.1 DUF4115 domain-containing protein [Parvibaculum sp.]MBO6676958.1 DUF4115 domain-containing protein [Parvibaculum sp.]MBO6686704.1 DUF4115 domain-containing protein [Parvibaculum sp.]MBO6904091.1 DUF4115 domain-containing protein [Parvibaculum sp.]
MNKITMLPTGDNGSEPRRRLHLRDITNEVPVEAESVGADLRAARLRRSEDLRSIAQCLRIRRDQLEALEESRYDALPARAYAVGFVRSYAEYLGLDSRHVCERYKAELDRNEAETAASLNFPDASEEKRLPRGTALIVALVVAAGAYGGWLLTKSTDEMMATRMADEAPAAAPAASSFVSGSRGDSASAATPSAGAVPVVRGPGIQLSETGISGSAGVAPETVYEPAPVVGEDAAEAAATEEMEVAALAEEEPVGLPPLPEGTPYGAENVDGRVVVRARRDGAWVRVEDAQGQVLIEQILNAGDSYRAPSQPGVILVARDASAFEIMVDGQSLGLAGPPTLVLTGKSLVVSDLLASMPKPAAPAEEGAEAALPAEDGAVSVE